MSAGISLAHPLVLIAAPLALLPWLPARVRLPRFSYLALLPRDRASDAFGVALRAVASLAIVATIVGLAAPFHGPTSVTRVGEGAEIVVLLDRSRSMDQPFGSQPGMHWSDTRRESKGQVARRLLAEFAHRRSADAFAFLIFSAQPMLVLDFSSSPEAIQAAIDAQNVGRGLGETDIARALEAVAALFEPRPYLGGRVVLLVSDGGAQIDARTRVRLATALRRERVALYWLYVRSTHSRSLAEVDTIDNPEAAPELALHLFLRSTGIAYRAYQAEDPQALKRAIEDIGKLERHPIYTLQMEPRREYGGRLYLLAAACAGLLLFAARMQRLEWERR
jgi:mxaC protein